MQVIKRNYARWCERADGSLADELSLLGDDEKALRDAFFQDLAFGTGGLRGVIGAGPNRMNVHTVARATQGLADYLNERSESPRVAIARDSRHMGEQFMQVIAGVLAANGVRALAYPRIEPTPALSWAVRDLGCDAGICITASHNPAAYNGYKVYGADGCQITTQDARDILERIEAVDIFDDVKTLPFGEALESGAFSWIGEDVLDRFVEAVASQSLASGEIVPGAGGAPGKRASGPESASASKLKVVYTPLHGTGLECVERIVKLTGGIEMAVVEEQAVPDGDFPTCPYPNPEVRKALVLGLEACKDRGADLLLATDPDADRMGIAVKHGDEYVLMSGNEAGMLMLDYTCRMHAQRGEDLADKVVATTIVSTPMADELAREYGFELRRTLTGFKFIGEQIGMLETAGQSDRFMFGFEESYGYLSGTHVRDKDAVNAVMLMCETARWHHAQGRDLVEAMDDLYRRFGYFREGLVSVDYPGADGAERMQAIMGGLRESAPSSIAGMRVTKAVDYARGADMPLVNARADSPSQKLPASNVMEFQLEGGSKLIIRPSGTEPKVKAYALVKEATRTQADALLDLLRKAAFELLA